jgi:hypothetical protein
VDVDALMMATGMPSLSARQQLGPDIAEWEKLDPGARHKEMWNRGGLHIRFKWTNDDTIEFSQPTADTVVLSGSPCEVAARMPKFRYAVSSEPLDQSCLTASGSFIWNGVAYTVYEVNAR